MIADDRRDDDEHGGRLRFGPTAASRSPTCRPATTRVRALSNTGGLVSRAGELVEAKVTVAGEDITGVRLTGVKASTVDRAHRPSSRRHGHATSLSTASAHRDPLDAGAAEPAEHGADQRRCDVRNESAAGQPADSHEPDRHLRRTSRIKAVRLNGADVTDSGLDVRPNEDLSGLEIELTTQLSDLSGFVSNARGDNVKDYSVVVFSRDRERWGFASRFLGGGRPDQDGKYPRAQPAGGQLLRDRPRLRRTGRRNRPGIPRPGEGSRDGVFAGRRRNQNAQPEARHRIVRTATIRRRRPCRFNVPARRRSKPA